MMSRHDVARAIGEGLQVGAKQAWSSYRSALVLRGHEAGFEDAYRVADAVPGWFDRVAAACFWSVVHEVRPRRVVEIGSYLGRSTVFLAESLRHAGIQRSELHAIDPHTGDRQHLEQLGLTSLPTLDLFRVFLSASGNHDAVRIHVASSSEAVTVMEPGLDMVFVDGWHEYDAVLADVRDFGKLLSPAGVMCVDDVVKLAEVDRASRQGMAAAGLTHYGFVAGRAWAGRAPEPPSCLRAVLRREQRFQRIASVLRHR